MQEVDGGGDHVEASFFGADRNNSAATIRASPCASQNPIAASGAYPVVHRVGP